MEDSSDKSLWCITNTCSNNVNNLAQTIDLEQDWSSDQFKDQEKDHCKHQDSTDEELPLVGSLRTRNLSSSPKVYGLHNRFLIS